jgi:epoxyqueuosine reductase
LTIEHRTTIKEEFHESIGDWIFGCDICQEVCPHNQPSAKGQLAEVHSAYKATHSSLDILEILQWDEEARRKAFQGSSMKRAKLGMMRRNALIVAGNFLQKEECSELYACIVEIAKKDEDLLVQQTAEQVLLRVL